ncbi:hypothetical protein HK405_015009, partial [Cladochytrium tenue]
PRPSLPRGGTPPRASSARRYLGAACSRLRAGAPQRASPSLWALWKSTISPTSKRSTPPRPGRRERAPASTEFI